MAEDDRCELSDCDHTGFVRVGIPPKLVCHCHFEEYLQNAADIVAHLREALTPQPVPQHTGNGYKDRRPH